MRADGVSEPRAPAPHKRESEWAADADGMDFEGGL